MSECGEATYFNVCNIYVTISIIQLLSNLIIVTCIVGTSGFIAAAHDIKSYQAKSRLYMSLGPYKKQPQSRGLISVICEPAACLVCNGSVHVECVAT